ncbi:hypothetical protein Acr_00g0066460 [Actinidia rufa]|uniref:Uncharacterized protein n=1 Tax=Actinidia rufa TaxID=165716 RepID=A0A7J0DQB6_9ERIC|nr:hypothetical protein Acr_00g0066460 [Actinidia rufa]
MLLPSRDPDKAPRGQIRPLHLLARARWPSMKPPCKLGWKNKFFFISGDNWEFAHRQSRELGVPKVPRSWSTPGKRCNVPPVLTEVEQERFDRISGTLEQGQFYPIKDILRLKSFLRSFGLDFGRMASSAGDNVKQKPAGNAAHVAADEGSSSSSSEVWSNSWLPPELRSDEGRYEKAFLDGERRGESKGVTSVAKGVSLGRNVSKWSPATTVTFMYEQGRSSDLRGPKRRMKMGSLHTLTHT